MTLHFYKYQGTGNDFILIDNRKKEIELEKQRKKAEKAAIKRGELPEYVEIVAPGHEPTIDPAILK